MVEPFRNIVDPELILFAEIAGQVVGWLPRVPNLNEAFIHANGLRYPWDYVRLWWHMKHQPECLDANPGRALGRKALQAILGIPAADSAGTAGTGPDNLRGKHD
jgi:hypothetical protein